MNIAQFLFLASFLVSLAIKIRRPTSLQIILLGGFLIRVAAALLDEFEILTLPWSGFDSEVFYYNAQAWAQISLDNIWTEFDPSQSYVYSWILSFFIRTFNDSYLFLRLLNVCLGTVLIAQVYYLVELIGNKKQAIQASFICAFFPVSIVMSAILIREALLSSIIAMFCYFIVQYTKNFKISNLAFSFISIILAAIIHGIFSLFLVIIPLSIIVSKPLSFINQTYSIKLRKYFGIFLAIFLTFAVFSSGLTFSKIGQIGNLSEFEDRQERIETRTAKGGSAYPSYLNQNIIRPDKIVIRTAYFLFSPFPWDWRGINLPDVLGSIMGMSYLVMTIHIVSAYFAGKLKRVRILLIFLLIAVLIFSFATTNIGTAIRHRNKFLPIFAMLTIYSRYQNSKKFQSRNKVHERYS